MTTTDAVYRVTIKPNFETGRLDSVAITQLPLRYEVVNNTAQTIPALKVVYKKNLSEIEIADTTQKIESGGLGIMIEDQAPGDLGWIVRDGVIEFAGWNWIPGKPIYFDNQGNLTQTVPPANGYSVQMGFAINATTMNVRVEPRIKNFEYADIPFQNNFIAQIDGEKVILESPDYHSGYNVVRDGETWIIRERKQSVSGHLQIEDNAHVELIGDLWVI